MNNIIQHFVKNVMDLEEKSLENLNNLDFLADFTTNLNDELMNLGREITLNMIEFLEEKIYNSSERKDKYVVYQKNSLSNERKLITIFGEIIFNRRYYVSKDEKSKKEYLLDRMIGIAEKERMLVNVEEKMLELATIKSYEFAGKNSAYGIDISKSTVQNKIEELDFENIDISYEKDNTKTKLYIQADEDHVDLQIGGIAMPRLVTVYEENTNGKLIGKRKFGGIYLKQTDKLWEEVSSYIEEKYGFDKIKRVYIMGDGANWIKTGLEWIPNSIYIADRFHIEKAILQLCGSNNIEYIKGIREAMYELDFKKVKELGYEILAEEMNSKIRNAKKQKLEYLLNNEEGFKNSLIYDVPGCAAEGDISHTYSDRMSSRPLGWKEENVDKMARLRVLAANKDNIKLVTRNRNNKQIQEKEEKQNKVRKMIKIEEYKREDGIIYAIPEIQCGDYEIRMKIKELIKCKAI